MYAFQCTLNAHVNPPDRAFSTVSTHRTEAAAVAALDKAVRRQQKRCGYGCWDQNYRVVEVTS